MSNSTNYFDSMEPTLNSFEYDAINYIYDMPPSQNNLFWAGNLCATARHQAGRDDGSSTNTKSFELFDASFRIQSVNFQMPTVNFEKNKFTKMDYVKEVVVPKEVTITYLEDVYSTVQMYHQEWLSCWYDIENDCMVSGKEGKYRGLDLVRFHFVTNHSDATENLNSFNLPIEVPKPEVVWHYKLLGLVPSKFEPVNFSYSDDGNGKTVSYSYNVQRIMSAPNPSLTSSSWNPEINGLTYASENLKNIIDSNQLPGAVL